MGRGHQGKVWINGYVDVHPESENVLRSSGDLVNYLKTYRLQWGKPDALSLIPSKLEGLTVPKAASVQSNGHSAPSVEMPELPADAPPYFTADTPPELISIIMNDWPYSGTVHTFVSLQNASNYPMSRSSTRYRACSHLDAYTCDTDGPASIHHTPHPAGRSVGLHRLHNASSITLAPTYISASVSRLGGHDGQARPLAEGYG